MKTKVINIDTSINSLINSGQQFTIIETSLSCELICKYGKFYWSENNNLKLHELGFIRQVWNYAQKLPIPKKVEREKIKYIDFRRNFNKEINCYEIDLKSAYWEMAFRNGFISKKIYEKGKSEKISKLARLVALGNLAKVKYHLFFNGNDYEFQGTTESEMKDMFFKCCLDTSEIMQNLKFLVNENFLFYWVDAIFVNSKDAMMNVCEYLDFQNLPYKVKFLPEIICNEKYIEVKQEDEKIKPKIYCKLKNNQRTPINKLLNLAKLKKDIEEYERRINNFRNASNEKIYKRGEISENFF